MLCVDATPNLVWKRISAIPRGILQQADDVVLLITSDTWAKTGGSEVLKTTDGTSLLHMPSLKLGAVLSTAGVFDGALAWQGNVDSLPIAHSKYSNRVELRKSGKNLLLLGRESSQEYAQTFDPATGKRLVSILRGRWPSEQGKRLGAQST